MSVAGPGGADETGDETGDQTGDQTGGETVDDILVLSVGPIAHGGHCVARQADGPVVFVRHALPGERVRARVTERRGGFWRADAIDILEAAPDRVVPPCPYARPGRCGGCDLQHATPAAQRRLKAAVVTEQLVRLGGRTDLDVTVEELPGGGFGWRSRVQYAVDPSGRPGFHRHRSHEVIPVDRCLIAHPAVQEQPVTARRWPGVAAVEVVGSSGGDVVILTARSRGGPARVHDGPRRIRERAIGREWSLDPDAFWQVHPAAPDILAGTVLDLLRPEPHERAWDLYAGAGLFAAALAPVVNRVTAVESDRAGVSAARRALAGLPTVRVVAADVRVALANPRWRAIDLVVLDPPRSGAGREVVQAIAARAPRAVAYVACDPAAFARDVATFTGLGYDLRVVRAFDAFPNTHHVECVGLFTPGEAQ
jgi:tRNA/tmRNA/rRNA uracil-C5-methylase (TrmA/RlmC/RlmD family)